MVNLQPDFSGTLRQAQDKLQTGKLPKLFLFS